MRVKLEFENGEVYEGRLCDKTKSVCCDAKGISHELSITMEYLPKKPVKRYRWWYEVDDCGHTYDGVTREHYTEEEFLKTRGMVDSYERIDATERVDYE